MNRKSNLQYAASLCGTILLAILICVIVFASLAATITNTFGTVLIQVVNSFLFLSMIYLPIWNIGDKDVNYVNTGKIIYDKYSGLKIGLMAMIILYLPVILLIISKVTASQIMMALYLIVNAEFFGLLKLMLPQAVEKVSWFNIASTLILPLVVPGMTSIAYYLGYKRISLAGKIIYKKKKK